MIPVAVRSRWHYSCAAECYRAWAIRTSGAHRVYAWLPRLLVQVSRLSLTVRRTLDVQRSPGFEHFATTFQPVSVCSFFMNRQNVSPAHAPSVVMTVGRTPSRKLCAEHVPASGAQTPTIMSLFMRSGLACSGGGCVAGSADPGSCRGGSPSFSPPPSFSLAGSEPQDAASTTGMD